MMLDTRIQQTQATVDNVCQQNSLLIKRNRQQQQQQQQHKPQKHIHNQQKQQQQYLITTTKTNDIAHSTRTTITTTTTTAIERKIIKRKTAITSISLSLARWLQVCICLIAVCYNRTIDNIITVTGYKISKMQRPPAFQYRIMLFGLWLLLLLLASMQPTSLIVAAVNTSTSVAVNSSAGAYGGAALPTSAQTSPHAAALVLSTATGTAAALAAASSSILEQFSPNCSSVAHIFRANGIDAAEIPTKPSNEMVLRYCESPSVGTCCTYTMETKMAKRSRMQLEKHSKEQIMKMSSLLGGKAHKFNDVFRKLLLESKEEFHNMFTRTYGVIYQQNSYVFSDLFNELENYFARGRVDLMEVMDKFFNTLYQKMFTVLNSQYSFDQNYLRCVSEHMKELKPFGDVPDKLSVQIKRSFVATRTYGQALVTAADVSKKLVNIRLNADCTAALTKLQHCGACKGYAEKPCTNYCVNVMKGCLHYVSEFDAEWENFVIAMDKVAERLLGSFNIVMVVEPINIKISEAIMNFQDAGQDITTRVFQGCGRPSLGRAKRAISPRLNDLTLNHFGLPNHEPKLIRRRSTAHIATHLNTHNEEGILDIDEDLDETIVLREKRATEIGGTAAYNDDDAAMTSTGSGGRGRGQKRKQQSRKHDNDNDYTNRDPILDKMVRDIRQRVKDTKKFWSNLPHDICNHDEVATSSDADGMCWNGHTIDRYMHSVTTEHGSNPEFPSNPATTRQTGQVRMQLYFLKNAINHLRNAYNGQDVDWNEQDELYYNSGSGSGGGNPDDEDDEEGSGLGGTDFAPSHKPDLGERPAVNVNNVDDEDDAEDLDIARAATTRPKHTESGTDTNVLHEHNVDEDYVEADHELSKTGSGSDTNQAKMSLRRALLLYLLPIYMAWFGGIFADML